MESNPESETLAQLANPVALDVPEPITTDPVAEAEGEEVEASGITLDGQNFPDEKSAYEYMKTKNDQLENEKLIMEARQDGMTEAMSYGTGQSAQIAEPVAPEPEINMDKFYEDPAQFLKDYGDKIRTDVETKVQGTQSAVQADTQAWGEFFTAHPDLDGFKEDCQMMLDANLSVIQTLARRDKKKAQDYLATKTREKFQNYIEKTKPTRVLSNTKSGPSIGGNGVTQTVTPQKDDGALDFVSQIRNMRG